MNEDIKILNISSFWAILGNKLRRGGPPV